jgi:GAF domain-containing protein/anti-sigma regulatory factor (Ser/Thr protein kinase)
VPPDSRRAAGDKVAHERSRLSRAVRTATERTEALQRVTAHLSAAATPQDVVDVAVRHGLATIGASGGSIAMPVRGVAQLHRVTAGYAPEDALSAWVEVPMDAPLPGPQAARTGASLWLPDRTAAELEFPLLAEVFARTPWCSLCALPLPTAERRGFFVAFFDEPQEFDAEARSFVETIVGLCAQALERADLLAIAELARDRARRLQALTAALSVAATPTEVAEAVVGTGPRATGAEAVLVYVRSDDVAELRAHAGYGPGVLEGWEAIPASADVPVWHVLRTSETLVFESPDDAKRRFPLLARTPTGAMGRPTIIAPFSSGEVSGVVCATYAAERGIVTDDVPFVETIALLSGQALERSRLLESERTAAERLARLQAVTERLGGAMTVQEVARIMVHEGVSALEGAAGALVLVTEDGLLETVEAIGYGDERLALYGRFAPEDAVVAAQVHSSREPRWVESLAEMTDTYPAHELALDPQLEAEAFVPLSSVRGTPLGVLLVSFAGPRRLTEGEKSLFLTLGRQCAQAIEKARTFERQSLIAEELQRSLLPSELPSPHLVSSAVRYLPGSAEADVGGDWYDLVAVGEACVGGGVGDVGGKGVLAASQMGQLRIALRAHTLEGLSPAVVLARLDALAKAGGVDLFATVVAFDIDLQTGSCRYASAGHPPPVLVRADGSVVLLDEAGSLPLGVGAAPRYVDAEIHVAPDETLFFYTDGLVERHSQPFDVGLARLLDSLAEHAGADPPELVDAVLDDLVSFGERPDDIAVLAVRPAPTPGERFTRRLPLEPTALSALRAELRAWLVQAGAEQVADDTVQSTSEALANAIEHAERPAQPAVEVEVSLRGGDVVVVVQDFGSWREPTATTDRGRGLRLMETLMDRVDIESAPRGTRVTLRRRLGETVTVSADA